MLKKRRGRSASPQRAAGPAAGRAAPPVPGPDMDKVDGPQGLAASAGMQTKFSLTLDGFFNHFCLEKGFNRLRPV